MSNLIFLSFELPVWTWILTALRLAFISPTTVYSQHSFSCTHLFSDWFREEPHWPCNRHSPRLCCLCPHHLLSSHLSSSLPSLCPTSLLSFISFSFSSTAALSGSFFPHSEFHLCPHMSIHPSLLLCPCQTLSNTFHPSLVLYGSSPPSVPSGYLPPGSSPLLQSPQRLSHLTQQDDDAQQDGNQSPRAETRRGEERLALAHPDPAVALAWAHPQGQGAGAAQRRLPTVPHHNGQLVQLLGQVVETPPPGNDAGRAVCNERKMKENKTPWLKRLIDGFPLSPPLHHAIMKPAITY